MKVKFFIRRNQPDENQVEQYTERMGRFKINFEKVDADSANGIALAEIYDIVSFPAILVSKDDGSIVQLWQGELPSVELVSSSYRI